MHSMVQADGVTVLPNPIAWKDGWLLSELTIVL